MSIWTDEELQQAYDDFIRHFCDYCPREVHDTTTFTTTADSRLIDISSLTTLLYGFTEKSFNSMYGVEYPVGEWPRKFRNFKIIGTDLEMDLDSAPSASGEEVYIRYYTVHTSTTIPTNLESLVNRGAAAFALINTPLKFLNEFMDVTDKYGDISTAIGNMTTRMTQAIASLTTSDSIIGDQRANAIAMVDSIGDTLIDIISLLTSGEDLIGSELNNILGKIDDVTEKLNLATQDLDSSRETTGDERATAISVLNELFDISSDIDDKLTTAEGYYNTSNVGNPETEWIRSAGVKSNQAEIKLNQASSYLGLESTSQSHRNNALAELSAAGVIISQARSLLVTEETAQSYRSQAAALQSVININLSRFRAYMQSEETARLRHSQSIEQLRVSSEYWRQARGYVDLLKTKMTVVNLGNNYRSEGERDLALIQRELQAVGPTVGQTKKWNRS